MELLNTFTSKESSEFNIKILENYGKIIAISVAAFYALGLILSNIHLSQFGLSDFNMFRPRFILVGFGYFVYLIVPLIVIFGPFYLLKGFMQTDPDLPIYMLLILYFSFLFFLFYMFGLGLHYFVTPPYFQTSLSGSLSFWLIYLNPFLILQITLVYIPSIIIITHSLHSKGNWPIFGIPNDILRLAKLCLVLGFFSIMIGYVYFVFPNVSFSIGGGQPLIVNLYFENSFLKDIPIFCHSTTPKEEKNILAYGPLLLWHQSPEFIYIGPAEEGTYSLYITAVKNQQVQAIEYLHGYTLFERKHLNYPLRLSKIKYTIGIQNLK